MEYALADEYDSSVRNTGDQNDYEQEEEEGGPMSLTIVTKQLEYEEREN